MALTLEDLRPDKGAKKDRTRVGRGHGSGKGKTAGRGTKGQKARTHAGVARGFEGGQLPIQKRMPYKRGFTNIFKVQWEVVNLDRLEDLSVDGPVTPQVLFEAGITRGLEFPVKILGNGDFAGRFDIQAHAFSEGAKARIEAAGGTVQTLVRTDDWMEKRPRSRRVTLSKAAKQAGVGKVGGPKRREALAALAAVAARES